MIFQKKEFLKKLKKFGYKVELSDGNLIIMRRIKIPLFFWAIIVFFGLYLIAYTVNTPTVVVGLLLIFTALVLYYRNVAIQITIDKKSEVILIKKGIFRINLYKKFSEVKELELRSFDLPTSATPFEKGNREYVAELRLIWQSGNSIELFNFENRSEKEVEIVDYVLNSLVEFTGFQKSIVNNK